MSSLALALAMLGGALLVACGDDDDANDDGNASEPSTTLSPEEEVEAAYLAYWDMLARLSRRPNPDDTEIPDRASGQALRDVRDGLRDLAAQGQTARTGPEYAHSVTAVDVVGSTAVVHDCAVDDSTIVDVESGSPVRGGQAATGLLEATLQEDDGVWRVNSVETTHTWAGITSCDS